MRRFYDGWTDEIAGVHFRVVAGSKACWPCAQAKQVCDHDLKLEWVDHDGFWRAIPMDAAFLLGDFFFENEGALYPPPRFQGGGKFLNEHARACRDGYESAVTRLAGERESKRTA